MPCDRVVVLAALSTERQGQQNPVSIVVGGVQLLGLRRHEPFGSRRDRGIDGVAAREELV